MPLTPGASVAHPAQLAPGTVRTVQFDFLRRPTWADVEFPAGPSSLAETPRIVRCRAGDLTVVAP